jgi:hypothetical protein
MSTDAFRGLVQPKATTTTITVGVADFWFARVLRYWKDTVKILAQFGPGNLIVLR